uniref:Hairy-related 5 n=1 Tax=Scophthalmus maximus TaxID=52904 RepID=A0A8D3AL87_SCOMX
MKALSPPQSPRQRTTRRVPKPLMEKRRRERINHSLETLRLLMLDSTHNEKLKNPKVEKAEILESVVQFLKTDKHVERVPSKEQTCARQHNYHDGMRSCLLRVSRFIATKGEESEDTDGETARDSLHDTPHLYTAQRTGLHCEMLSSAAACTHITDPVWRPWPQ